MPLMDKITKVWLKDKSTYIYGTIAIVFIIIGIYVYVKYLKKDTKYINNKEYGPPKETEATLYYFETDWCPYCKKAKPEWDALQRSVGTTKIHGTIVNFRVINCDDDTATADKYKVENYPTIVLVNGENTYKYDAKVDRTLLRKFLDTSLVM